MTNKQIIKNFPHSPGVYLFKNKQKQVIYIGKALDLKKRLANYWQKKTDLEKARQIVSEADSISYQTVKTELEAVLLEAKLIKAYQPKYNSLLKDDSRFLYLAISREKFPRIFLTRRPEDEKSLLDWFGPFPSAGSLKEIYRLLRRIFPFRSCLKLKSAGCLYGQISLCSRPCQNKISQRQYRLVVKKIQSFFNGQYPKIITQLSGQRDQLAKQELFEQAAGVNQQIIAIQTLFKNYHNFPQSSSIEQQLDWLRQQLICYQKIDPTIIQRLEAYDVANLDQEIVVGSMVVLNNGEPEPSQYRQFNLKSKFSGDPAAIKEIIQRRLTHQDWLYPQVILVDGGQTQISQAFLALVEVRVTKQICLIGLAKNPKGDQLIIPRIERQQIISWQKINLNSKTSGILLLQKARNEAHRFAQRYFHKRHHQAIFSELK